MTRQPCIRIVPLLLLSLCLAVPLIASAGLTPLTGKPKAVSEEDWKNAQGKPSGEKDLRVVGGGHYIGGIDRDWALVITGPPTNKVFYSFQMLPGPGHEFQGTYEVKEGLAWFNGQYAELKDLPGKPPDKKVPGTTRRFALNFRHLDDKTYFNLVCKDAKGNYQYERRWFQPDEKEWIPLRDHKLTFTPQESTDKQLKFKVNAEITRWDDKGKKPDRHFFEIMVTYNDQETYWVTPPGQPVWLPTVLRPHGGKMSAKELPECFHLHLGGFGQVSGFVFDEPPKWDGK